MKLERYGTYTCIFDIIIYEFTNKHEFCLIILLFIKENLENRFDYSILSFSLAMYFLIKNNKKFWFYNKKIV